MYNIAVAPFAGAWIEIINKVISAITGGVAPFAGAWIEIVTVVTAFRANFVAPFAGAWIEINLKHQRNQVEQSLPSRERGLKLQRKTLRKTLKKVAPFAGAWIEICITLIHFIILLSRSLRGSVD